MNGLSCDVDELTVSGHDGVTTVTWDRSKHRNALSQSLLSRIADLLAKLEGSDLRAVVLRGANDCFSAGADLGELDGSLADLSVDEAVAKAAGSIRDLSVPVIAAIEGPCVGAAVELAMACDLRIASRSAFFQLPAVRLGILYRPAAVAELARRLPEEAVTRLLLFGERIDAEEAARLQLVATPVTSAGDSIQRAFAMASLLPASPWPALPATKRVLAGLRTGTDPAEFEAERRKLAVSPERAAALAEIRHRRSERSV